MQDSWAKVVEFIMTEVGIKWKLNITGIKLRGPSWLFLVS